MTTAPFEPRPGDATPGEPGSGPGTDLGAGGPADDAGTQDGSLVPPGYPEEVDPAEGPLAGRDTAPLGDLQDPGAEGTSAQG